MVRNDLAAPLNAQNGLETGVEPVFSRRHQIVDAMAAICHDKETRRSGSVASAVRSAPLLLHAIDNYGNN